MSQTKRERLEADSVLEQNAQLTPEQEQAIESLTDEEINALVALRNRIKNDLRMEMLISPPTHHH